MTKAWIEAARPRTLPASAAPVIAATAYAAHDSLLLWQPALLCLLFALLAQIASNLGNDYFDFKKGTDRPDRTGPQRAVASGLISPRKMLVATVIVLAAACIVGLGLIYYGGWWLLPIGACIAIFALAYSAGPYPLSYHGLGDLTVFVFFGLIPVNLTYYVQAGFFSLPVFLGSISIGLLSINILLINNYRDMEEDAENNKNTTVVLFGRRFAANWYLINGIAAPLFTWHVWFDTPGWRTLLPIIYWAAHIATYRALIIRKGTALNPLLGRTAANLLLFTFLLVIALTI